MIEASTFSAGTALFVFEFCVLALSDIFPISVRGLCLCLIRRRVTAMWTDSIIRTSSAQVHWWWEGDHNDQANIWQICPSTNVCQINHSWEQCDSIQLAACSVQL